MCGATSRDSSAFCPADRREDLVFLARQFSDILIAFFRGQILIGLLLGLVLALGFALVGLKFGILLGLFLGLLNIIPYLGTMIGILIVLPMAFYQEGGGLPLIGWCALVFLIGQILTDYVFTPRIMGDKTGMGPMLIIVSIFFWGTALGGILGMVLAIPAHRLLPCLLAPGAREIPTRSDRAQRSAHPHAADTANTPRT